MKACGMGVERGFRAGLVAFFDHLQLHTVVTSVLRYEDQIAKLQQENRMLSSKLNSTKRELKETADRLQCIEREYCSLQDTHHQCKTTEKKLLEAQEELKLIKEKQCYLEDKIEKCCLASNSGPEACEDEEVDLFSFHHDLSLVAGNQSIYAGVDHGRSLHHELSMFHESHLVSADEESDEKDENDNSQVHFSPLLKANKVKHSKSSEVTVQRSCIEHEQRIALLEGQLETALSSILQLEETLTTYKDKCNVYEDQCKRHLLSSKHTSSKLKASEATELNLKSTIRRMNAKLEKMVEQLRTSQDEVNSYKAQSEDVMTRLDTVQDELVEADRRIDEQVADIEDYRNRISSLEHELSSSETSILKQKTEFHVYKLDHTHSNEEFEDLEEKLWELEYDKEELNGKLYAKHRYLAMSVDSVFSQSHDKSFT